MAFEVVADCSHEKVLTTGYLSLRGAQAFRDGGYDGLPNDLTEQHQG
jgi:hypothetical protein